MTGPASPGPWPAAPEPAAGAVRIRPLRASDGLEAELDLHHRAFGPVSAREREFWRAEVSACAQDERQYGAWRDGRLVGTARFYDMRQWWGGRALRAAGVGGVKVAPEERGRGIGRLLMTELLRVMAGRGYAVCVLYPATLPLYRALGWELAGGLYRARVPARSLRNLLPPDRALPGEPAARAPARGHRPGEAPPPGADGGQVPVRRAGPEDAEAVTAVLGAVYRGARDCGPCTFDPGRTRRWLADPEVFGYLAPDGFLAYGWHGGDREIMVHALQAASARTARALWGIVASHASVTEVVHVNADPRDALGWLTADGEVDLRRHRQWMLRVLDPEAAVAGRGFPAGTEVSVALDLADAGIPSNQGPRTLIVRGGEGRLRPGRSGTGAGPGAAEPVRLGPRGLAALFAGTPMAALRLAGLARGGDARCDAALDAAFACDPYLLDYF